LDSLIVALPLIVLLALCGVFCLAPLSLYLSWLSILNRRPHPTVLRGSTDLLGLFVGLSGFLGIGGILIIALTHSNARFVLRGNWTQIQSAWQQEQDAWLFVAVVYTLIVAAFAITLAVLRSRTLYVYSVDRWLLDNTIDELLTDLGKTATRTGQLWTDALPNLALHGRDIPATKEGLPILEVNHFEGMWHSTIKLRTTDRRLAEEIERELRLRLSNCPEVENLSAVWILWAGITALLVMCCCLLLVLYYLYLVRR
jgi:hypothetical protein